MNAHAFWCPGRPRIFDKPDRVASLPIRECDRSHSHGGHSYVAYAAPVVDPKAAQTGERE